MIPNKDIHVLGNLYNDKRASLGSNRLHFLYEPFDKSLSEYALRTHDKLTEDDVNVDKYNKTLLKVREIVSIFSNKDIYEPYMKEDNLIKAFGIIFANEHNVHINNTRAFVETSFNGLDYNVLGGFIYNMGHFHVNDFDNMVDRKLEEWKHIAKVIDLDITKTVSNIEKLKKNNQKFNIFKELNNEMTNVFKNLRDVYELSKFIEKENNSNSDNKERYRTAYNELIEAFNDKNKLFNNPDYYTFDSLLKSIDIKESLNQINKEFGNIYQQIIDTKEFEPLTYAEAFMRKKDETSTASSFLKQKIEKDNRDDDLIPLPVHSDPSFMIELPKTAKYTNIIVFDDNSMLIEDNKGNTIIPKNNTEANQYLEPIFLSIVDLTFKKNPTLASFFKGLLADDFKNIGQCYSSMRTFLDNENILKANGFEILNQDLKSKNENPNVYARSNFEFLSDNMNKCIDNHKLKQYAHSIASNKYMHLYNEETYAQCALLMDQNIEAKLLQQLIGKKIAAFKTPEEFNSAIKSTVESFNGFNYESLMAKGEYYKSKLISETDNILIFKIDNYQQSQSMGSSSWCISRDEFYFNSYVDDANFQYFIYDLNKNSSDISSMIGITVEETGKYVTSHLKNDDAGDELEMFDLQLSIILKDIDNYPDLDETLRTKIDKINRVAYEKVHQRAFDI